MSRENDLAALCEVFAIVDGNFGGLCLFISAESVGEIEYAAIALGCWQFEWCGLFSIVVEERICSFDLDFGVRLEVIGVSLF